jgi:AcrR family transcriptional regulator
MSLESRTKRKYELKQRAREMAETHLRITEAAIELHGTVGPSRTTMSAVAERAGVERRTLYRHFPNEAALFEACSEHYFDANPWPDLGPWRAIRDPQQRLERALDELYAYYERNEPMFSNVLRDAELVDVARDAVAPLHAYLEEAAEILAAGRSARGRRRQLLEGALHHALAFSTWHSLTANGIGRSDAAKLVTALVEAAVTPLANDRPQR